jgi:hypothetical protein
MGGVIAYAKCDGTCGLANGDGACENAPRPCHPCGEKLASDSGEAKLIRWHDNLEIAEEGSQTIRGSPTGEYCAFSDHLTRSDSMIVTNIRAGGIVAGVCSAGLPS